MIPATDKREGWPIMGQFKEINAVDLSTLGP